MKVEFEVLSGNGLVVNLVVMEVKISSSRAYFLRCHLIHVIMAKMMTKNLG